MGAQDQRPSFFEGQFLSADDLKTIVDYQRSADARHALAGHTWGIALGLNLTEKSSSGAPHRVEVVLQPGFAWDGFGRPIVVDRVTRLSESLFADIPFNNTLDDPANGTGRLVSVWIAYDEIASRNPAPGVETCATDDQHSRITQTFRFIVGEPGPSQEREPVTIGTTPADAEGALNVFDTTAPDLYDTSVPHQTFPCEGRPPRWLIPIGKVRWIARQNALGYFADVKLKAGKPGDDYAVGEIRAFRRYIGVVAEYIEAADGAIVLHKRSENPERAHRYATLLSKHSNLADLQEDLVWVEGNLRVGGDAKINGGKLHLRDEDGNDGDTPLYLARHGDGGAAPGKRELRISIGKGSQKDNKLFVGPEQAPAGGGVQIAPRLVVVSGVAGNDQEGRVGINTDAPKAALEVKGDWDGSEDGAVRLSGTQPTIRFTGNESWIVQVDGTGTFKLAHRSGAAQWDGAIYATPQLNVGIGSATPVSKLQVAGDMTLEKQAGGPARALPAQATTMWNDGTWLRLNQNLDYAKPIFGVHTPGVFAPGSLNVGGAGGWGDPGTSNGWIAGNLSVGTTSLNARLTLEGRRQPEQGRMSFFSDSADIEYDGGNDGLFVFKDTGGKTLFKGGNVGIGDIAPAVKLHVNGARIRLENGGKRLDLRTDGGAVDLQSDTHDLYLSSVNNNVLINPSAANGNVGVGTTNPTSKLHVVGTLSVQGSASKTTGIHWTNISDAALKRNIEPLAGALDTLLQLRGVAFEWKDAREMGAKEGRHMGLIAQEVEKVIPEWIEHDQTEFKAINPEGFEALAIEAIRELKSEIDELKATIASLKLPRPAPKKTRRS